MTLNKLLDLNVQTVEHHTVTRATRYSTCLLCSGVSPLHLPGCPEDPATVDGNTKFAQAA